MSDTKVENDEGAYARRYDDMLKRVNNYKTRGTDSLKVMILGRNSEDSIHVFRCLFGLNPRRIDLPRVSTLYDARPVVFERLSLEYESSIGLFSEVSFLNCGGMPDSKSQSSMRDHNKAALASFGVPDVCIVHINMMRERIGTHEESLFKMVYDHCPEFFGSRGIVFAGHVESFQLLKGNAGTRYDTFSETRIQEVTGLLKRVFSGKKFLYADERESDEDNVGWFQRLVGRKPQPKVVDVSNVVFQDASFDEKIQGERWEPKFWLKVWLRLYSPKLLKLFFLMSNAQRHLTEEQHRIARDHFEKICNSKGRL